jgi:hypothetical protein
MGTLLEFTFIVSPFRVSGHHMKRKHARDIRSSEPPLLEDVMDQEKL